MGGKGVSVFTAVVAPHKTKRIHITMPNSLYLKAKERMKVLGHAHFSEYVRALIVNDLKSARTAVEQGGGR
ncbi:MAG: hypothetical protein QW324_07645 [Thermofilaceae archaeon]